MTIGKAIVDTNVPIVANGSNDKVSPRCRLCTMDFLEEMMSSGILVVDSEGRVENEYFSNLRLGYPGVGNRFIQHFFSARADKILRVDLGPENESGFSALKFDGGLKNFDKSDRKFAALSVVENCPVYVSVDTDWAISFDALSSAGVQVKLLCGINQKEWFA